MPEKYFLHQIKRTNGEFSKGIVVADTFEAAKQGYHAYLGAYAYGHDANTDYVQCMITNMNGARLDPYSDMAHYNEVWTSIPQPEPEE